MNWLHKNIRYSVDLNDAGQYYLNCINIATEGDHYRSYMYPLPADFGDFMKSIPDKD